MRSGKGPTWSLGCKMEALAGLLGELRLSLGSLLVVIARFAEDVED